jgi:hypothetical protein
MADGPHQRARGGTEPRGRRARRALGLGLCRDTCAGPSATGVNNACTLGCARGATTLFAPAAGAVVLQTVTAPPGLHALVTWFRRCGELYVSSARCTLPHRAMTKAAPTLMRFGNG